MQGSDLGGISAVHLAKFGFDERTVSSGSRRWALSPSLSSPDSPRDAPTRKKRPLPRNRFWHPGAALQCRETWVRPAPGRRRSAQLTHRALGAASRPLPPAAAAAAAAAAREGGGRGAEPGRSGNGGGPGGGGRCGPGGGVGYPLAPALTRGRDSGVRATSLKVLRVRLRPAQNLGRGPGTLWSASGAERRKTRGPRGEAATGGRRRLRGSRMPPLFGLPPRPREAARSFIAPALPAGRHGFRGSTSSRPEWGPFFPGQSLPLPSPAPGRHPGRPAAVAVQCGAAPEGQCPRQQRSTLCGRG
ncbi:TPA: hypothetical protein BOS_8669 [Bos taurus]|nr:TPA: hypothetical protein BOS_8669 [Bos taurus]